MKRYYSYWFTVTIFLLMVAGCKKEDDMKTPGGAFLRWYDFRKSYMFTTQEFNANAGGPFSITGSMGTKINFPAGAFVDFMDSTKVITGNIKLVMQEVNSRKDLAINGSMVGYTGGQQWIVGGELQSLSASQNENAIKVNPALPAGSIAVNLPSTTGAGNNLSVYYLNGVSSSWINGGTATGTSTYNFSIEKLRMLGMLSSDYSCAKPDATSNAMITVKVNYEDPGYNPNPPTNDQVTVARVIYKMAPSVVALGSFDYANNSTTGSITAGRTATIVVFSGGPIPGTNSSTYLYFGTLTVNLQAGQTYEVDLKKISKSDLDAILNII